MQKLNTITPLFLEIEATCYFTALGASLGRPGPIQQKLDDQTVASMNILLHAKNELNK